MQKALNLNGLSILVTGASGFIGGRLAEYLALDCNARVRALVRGYGRAVHIARLPVELVQGDLTDADSMIRAVDGCDIVFHCGGGSAVEEGEQSQVTGTGTENLIRAALASHVRRFIHISTIAVHGPDPGTTVDENAPYLYTGDAYSDAKIDAEKLAFRYAKTDGLPLVVLRPTVVYGPRSIPWTITPISRMKAGEFTLIGDGSGLANHVYVDDVVQALLLAATKDQAIGEAFVISHGTGVSWAEFYGYYARMLGGIDLPNLTLTQIREQRRLLQRLRSPLFMGLSFVASPHARSIIRQLRGASVISALATGACPRPIKQRLLHEAEMMRAVKLSPPALPRQWNVDYFSSKCLCNIEKARNLLGYKPRTSLDYGMQLTEAWLRYVAMV